MPKTSAYKGLELYQQSKKLVIACYELTHALPEVEKTNFTRFIRMAALNLHLNIAQAAFKTKKRAKYIRGAQQALVIIDAAIEMLAELGFVTPDQTDTITLLTSSCFDLLDQL